MSVGIFSRISFSKVARTKLSKNDAISVFKTKGFVFLKSFAYCLARNIPTPETEKSLDLSTANSCFKFWAM